MTRWILIFVFVCLPSLASAQGVVYDLLKIEVSSGPCPDGWTLRSESVTTDDRYLVRVPEVLGGRGFYVTSALVNSAWPTPADKTAAKAAGKLRVTSGGSRQAIFCFFP